MITAETLGLPVNAVRAEIGDTNHPFSGGSGGSTTDAWCGSYNTTNSVGFNVLPYEILGATCNWYSGSAIVASDHKYNDEYVKWSAASTVPSGCTSRYMLESVATHASGHTFGLGHTSEDGSSQNTCMDYYSNKSDSDMTSTSPNAHDYSMLESIYSHTHASVLSPLVQSLATTRRRPAFSPSLGPMPQPRATASEKSNMSCSPVVGTVSTAYSMFARSLRLR